jgi:hypothetical protein
VIDQARTFVSQCLYGISYFLGGLRFIGALVKIASARTVVRLKVEIVTPGSAAPKKPIGKKKVAAKRPKPRRIS